jgi:hypothetical protein
VRHQNPVSKEWEEKHMKDRPTVPLDDLSHLYTLHVKKDNTFTISIDGKVVREGKHFIIKITIKITTKSTINYCRKFIGRIRTSI